MRVEQEVSAKNVTFIMRTAIVITVASGVFSAAVLAQELKPVPKDSVRVSITGCTKGYIFTAGPRREDQPGSLDIPEGMHLRMNGPKPTMTEIKAHEGSMIVITGLMKKGQLRPDGVGVGGGVRITPGPAPGASVGVNAVPSQALIDVEGWHEGAGRCPAR
jgi:hypothetical protein